jgi:eukaryotic-like serine/threonine-protein kinase
MSNRFDQEYSIFSEAILRSPAERRAFLLAACSDQADLLQRVEALLDAHDGASGFLDTSASRKSLEEPAIDQISRFNLIQRIGEGGCGIVYLADQLEPIRRTVAVKVIKPGMDSRNIVARFESERQVLALMDHPYIASIFDAGTTSSGRPFFAMEYVHGTRITDFCDQNSLTVPERLELLILVAQAIQHAHQKGIIHRDIKPSNVLVTFVGESPVPKVIDFGIAKAISGQLSGKTVYTAFELLIGTPEYMSPEQASMATNDVDTRSDIYSLGVLLYELLTGTTPFDTNRLFKSGLDEVRRVIREVEPTKPSTRLAVAPPADANLTSTRRKTDPVRLVRSIKGDLDWIALKALEKSPSRRYQTAAAFADDLRHYLSSEPVVARPPSPAYRFRKLVQRNKVLVGAGSAIVLSLVLGLAAAIYSLKNERLAHAAAEAARNQALQDRRVALEEAAKSRQVTKFLGEMLQSVGPSVAVGRDTSLLREVADRTADRVGVDLTNQPAVQAEIWHMLGGVYRELGEHARAEKMLKHSLDKRETTPTSSTNLAALYQDLGLVLLYQHSLSEAERFLLKATTLREASLSNLNSPEAVTAFEMLAMLRWNKAGSRKPSR